MCVSHLCRRIQDEGDDSNGGSSDADDGVVWMTDTSEEAARRRAEEQLTAATAAMVTQVGGCTPRLAGHCGDQVSRVRRSSDVGV